MKVLADIDEIVKRQQACDTCEHKKPGNGLVPARCGLCGCVISLKVRVKATKCADKENPKW